MCASVRAQCLAAIRDYAVTPRPQWVLRWPAMVVIAVSGIFWAKGVEDGIGAGALGATLDQNTAHLLDLTDLVRGELTELERTTLGALITIDVHARDVVAELAGSGVAATSDFEWVKQLRYYWRDGLRVDMVQVRSIIYTLLLSSHGSARLATPSCDLSQSCATSAALCVDIH